MRKLATYLLSLVFPLSLLSQNFDWLRITGDIDNDFGQWVQADSAGNVYVAGHAQGNCNFDGQVITSADPFWFVAKYDSNGFNIWVTKISIPYPNLFVMNDFKVNKKGETYIVGHVNGGGLNGMLIKVGATGNLIKKTTPSQTQNITSIAFDSNDNYYIGGVGYQSGNTNMFFSRYSSTDVISWQTIFTGSYGLYSNLSLRVSSDNSLLLSFIFKNSVTISDQLSNSIVLDATQGILDDDRVVAKYNSDGEIMWAEKYDDKMPSRQIEIDASTGNFYILAYDDSGTDEDFLIRFNASGNQLSSQAVFDQSYPIGWAPHIRIHNDNLYFIGGGLSLRAGGHSIGFFTLKRFDLDGNLTGQFNPPQQMNSILGDVAFHENSIYLVGGTYNGTWGNEVFTAHGVDYGDFFLTKMRENNISAVSNVEEAQSQIAFEVYPNPVQDNVYVKLASETKGEIVLRDITGKVLSVLQTTGEQTQVISLSKFGSGIFFISWSNGAQVTTKKIVKL